MLLATTFIATLSLVIAQVPDGCQSIKSTNACSPWSGNDLYIDSTKLAQAYGLKDSDKLDAAAWEKAVIDTTSGGQTQALMWKDWAQCSGYNGELIQYYRSYVCLTDIFVLSARCNVGKVQMTPLCSEACTNYGGALTTLMNNNADCPTVKDQKILAAVEKRRSFALRAADSCQKLSQTSYFNLKEQCVPGIKSDQESCGFGGNATIAQAYCQNFPNAACCSHVAKSQGSNQRSSLSPIQRAVMMWEAVQGSESSSSGSSDGGGTFFGSPVFIGGLASLGLAAVGAAGYVTVNRQKKHGYVPPPLTNISTTSLDKSTSGRLTPPSIQQVSKGIRCRVKFEYRAELPDELDLEVDDIVIFDILNDDGWGRGQNVRSGKVGMASITFMERLDDK
ncbi:hypothetical protein HDV02_006724 [Globomyces sp. JEL0801]|nr:hypothetical protein HDV02_006724 [Globomyces sp. JEL0801]